MCNIACSYGLKVWHLSVYSMLEQLGACLMFADLFVLLPILHIR